MSRRPLRVCHVAYTFYELDNRVLRYAAALAGRGEAVDVISLRRPGVEVEEPVAGVRCYRIQRRSTTEKSALSYLFKLVWFLLKSTVWLSALQMRRRYDVVHVHNVPDFLVFAAWLPKLMGARIVLDIHDILPELYAGKFGITSASLLFRALVAVERASGRFADHVIVANHLWPERLVERGLPPSKCTPVLNYPDLSIFKSRPEPAPRPPYVVLYPGTLNHHQGVDIAVRAFALAAPRMPGAEFHIYGRGPALPELMRLATELGVAGTVKFMESVDLNRIAAVMASAHAGVVPKRADGFGNEAFSTKTLEFMACGLPLAVSRTRVDQYYFTEEVVNFFTPHDAADLAEVLVQMYEQPETQRTKAEAGLALAARYSWQAHTAEYEDLVDALVVGGDLHRAPHLQEIR